MIKTSTSAIAHGRTLDKIIDELCAMNTHIEVAIGPRPSPKAMESISLAVDKGISLSAHANFMADKPYNQDRNFEEIIKFCVESGISEYSIHAPRCKQYPTWNSFLEYLKPKVDLAQQSGINFAIETMYVADNPYWLDSYDQVTMLYDHASNIGWNKFLIVDVAHLQICKNFGTWKESNIQEILTSDLMLELHFSDNDKVHDVHKPYEPGTNNQIDFWMSLVDPSITLVDEGRRRP